MFLKVAKLKKKVTDDGLAKVWDDVPLGKTYVVDLDSKRSAVFFNIDTQKQHVKEIINEESGGYLFYELLEIAD